MISRDHPNYRCDENGLEWLDFGDGKRISGPAAISGDGRVLLTVQDRGGAATIYDIDSGNLIGKISPESPLENEHLEGRRTPFKVFKVFIESVALNHNGSKALLGLNDSTAGVFDVETGNRLSTLREWDSDVEPEWDIIRAASFSPDSTLLVVGFWNRTIGIWSAETGDLVTMLRHPAPMRRYAGKNGFHEQRTTSASISRDNRYAFAGFGDMSAMVWEISTGNIVFDAFRHIGDVVNICEAQEGLRWATTCGEVWQVAGEGKPTKLLETGEQWWEAVFHPAGDELIVRRSDRAVKKWEIGGANTVLSAQPFDWRYTLTDNATIVFDRSGEWQAFPEGPNVIRTGGRTAQRVINTEAPIRKARLSPDGNYLATLGQGSSVIELWDIPSSSLRHRLPNQESVFSFAISRDGRRIAAGIKDGVVRIWNTDTGKEEFVLQSGFKYPGLMAFAPDNLCLYCVGGEAVHGIGLGVNSWERGKIYRLQYDDLDNSCFVALSNGVVILFREKTIEAWDRWSECIWESTVPYRSRYRFDFRNEILVDLNETRLVLALDGGRIGIWSLANGALLRIVSQDIPRPRSLGDLFDTGGKDIPFWGKTMWDAPGGPYFHVHCELYGRAVYLPRSADGRFTLIDLEDHVAMIALDHERGVAQRMPFRGYAKAMCIADDRLLALNWEGELFLNEYTD